MINFKPYAPYRDFRRGCTACFVLSLCLLLLMLVLCCLLGLMLSRWFTPTTQAAGDGGPQVVMLAPAIPEASYSATARGVFLNHHVEVNVAPGNVLLSSTPDGSGPLMTDDLVALQVAHADGSKSEWSHDFRAGDHPGVVPLPAQNITALFRTGPNTVYILLYDLTPPTYSSLPYYLIFTAPSSPSPTPMLTATPSVTPAPITQVPSLTPTRVNPTNTAMVVHTTPTLTASPAVTAVVPIPVSASTDSSSDSGWGNWVLYGGGILFAGVVVLSYVKSHRTPPQGSPALYGWVDLYDNQTRESCPSINLARYPQGLTVHLNPLQIKSPDDKARCIIAILPTEDGAMLKTNNAPIVNALGRDAELESQGMAEGPDQLLRDGMRFLIGGRLELEYRDPRPNSQVPESWRP